MALGIHPRDDLHPDGLFDDLNFPSGDAPWTIGDATTRVFDKAQALADLLEKRRGGKKPAGGGA